VETQALRGTEAGASRAYRAIVAWESVATHAHSAFCGRTPSRRETDCVLRTNTARRGNGPYFVYEQLCTAARNADKSGEQT
jgi:hypothetical protein